MARRIGSGPRTKRRQRAAGGWRAAAMSVVGLEIEARVEARHLLAVTIERKRGPPLGKEPALADAPLARLAPARMVDRRVDVGKEPVLAGVLLLPRGLGLLVG